MRGEICQEMEAAVGGREGGAGRCLYGGVSTDSSALAPETRADAYKWKRVHLRDARRVKRAHFSSKRL